MHEFADNSEVVEAATGLINRESDQLLVKLPRSPGRKDAEYMHLFSGPVDVEAYASEVESSRASETSSRVSVSELAERVSTLEAEVAELKKLLE